jgi:hypothetical protein
MGSCSPPSHPARNLARHRRADRAERGRHPAEYSAPCRRLRLHVRDHHDTRRRHRLRVQIRYPEGLVIGRGDTRKAVRQRARKGRRRPRAVCFSPLMVNTALPSDRQPERKNQEMLGRFLGKGADVSASKHSRPRKSSLAIANSRRSWRIV